MNNIKSFAVLLPTRARLEQALLLLNLPRPKNLKKMVSYIGIGLSAISIFIHSIALELIRAGNLASHEESSKTFECIVEESQVVVVI